MAPPLRKTVAPGSGITIGAIPSPSVTRPNSTTEKEHGMKTRIMILAALALAVAVGPAVGQQLTDNIQIHGFAGWGYGQTDGNTYSTGHRGRERTTTSTSPST